MSADNLFYPHAIEFEASVLPAPPTTEAALIENVSADRNYAITKHSSSSGFAPCFVGVDSSSPQISWSAKELDVMFGAILAQVTPATQSLVRSVASGTVNLWYRAGTKRSFREDASDSVHMRCRLISNAMLFWDSLQADPSIATVSMNLVSSFTAQGTDLMQVQKQIDSLPTPGCDEIYALSKVIVNGTEVKGVQSVSWNNNVQQASRISAGETGPGYIGIDQTEPVITITTDDLTEFADSNEGGDALTGSGVQVFLQRKSRTNYFSSRINTDHIQLSAAAGIKVVPSASGGPASNDIVCHVEQSGGSPIMAVSLGQAIPS